MSHFSAEANSELLICLRRGHQNNCIDELLDQSTQSKPAVWCRSSQTLSRIHLEEDDERLPECKSQIRAIKAAIKAQLIEEFGEETYMARFPFDKPLIKEQHIAQ